MSTEELSEKQCEFLRWLAKAERAYETRGSESQQRDLRGFGVPWRLRNETISPVERASDSRALARLERRGLILRQNINRGAGQARRSADEPHARTTHVQLTTQGRTIAQAASR